MTFDIQDLTRQDYEFIRKLVYEKSGINLVVWVDRKSAALSALGATLETVLAKSRRKLGCPHASPACYVLSLQLVDDRDVQERRGYGMLIENVFLRSVPVWARFEEQSGPTGSPHWPMSFSSWSCG